MPATPALLIHPGHLLLLGALSLGGCLRLGPDFQPPAEAWSKQWQSPALEQASERGTLPDLRQWWQVFADPVLDRLISDAEARNSSLKIAGLRVLEARAQLGIADSGRYPQLQQASADSLYIDRDSVLDELEHSVSEPSHLDAMAQWLDIGMPAWRRDAGIAALFALKQVELYASEQD